MIGRREFLHSSLAAGIASQQAQAASAKPNFLFLIADDLTYRAIENLNNPEVATPNLNRLMKQGCTFTHCFHQGSWTPAVCVASRSMLNSGLTVFRAQRNIEKTPLWTETMGANGYDTSMAGKWHLSKPNLNRAFKHTAVVAAGMFESGPTAYHRPSPGNTWSPYDHSLKGQWLETKTWQPGSDAPIKHSARIFSEAAVDYLSNRKNRTNPFLLYVGFTSPHDPRQAPKEYVDRYPKERIKVPPNYLPEHPFDQGDMKIRDEILAPFPRTPEAVQLHRSEYYAHIDYLDNQIGHILDALEKSGEASNTYVIFTADHGLAVGQHGLMGKQNMYDHSTRIPLIVGGPGIPAGKTVDELVYQHSVFATSCELSGVARPSTVEFPSLVDLLQGPGKEKHDAVFCYYRGFQRSVRTREHKLIVYPQAGRTQLFDLKKDPWEIHDLAGGRKHTALKQSLLERLHRFQKDLEDDIPPVSIA
jgi:arylsulfatase A-like enzyme